MNCPICNKTGLSDFTKDEIICPQCNSNLKGFVKIEQSSKFFKRIQLQKKLYLITVVLISVIATYVFLNNKSVNQDLNKNSVVYQSVDTIYINDKKVVSSEITFYYIIKNGDNLSKISYFFYNDWSLYKKIESDNNLRHDAILKPSDTLLIKLDSTRWKH